jgi:hypothetical protein
MDVPGSLTDPSEPLPYSTVPGAAYDIDIGADRATAAVRVSLHM